MKRPITLFKNRWYKKTYSYNNEDGRGYLPEGEWIEYDKTWEEICATKAAWRKKHNEKRRAERKTKKDLGIVCKNY